MAENDLRHYRMQNKICYNCGKVSVSQAINCVPCQVKLNEHAQLFRWDRQIEHEEYLRGDKGLIPSEEAAEIMGIPLRGSQGLYAKVERGEIAPAIKGVGGFNGHSWYKRSELLEAPARG